MNIIEGNGLDAAAARELAAAFDRRYAVVDERHDTELGFYAPVGSDPQQPHDRDELYIVASGRGVFRRGERAVRCAAGDLLFVPAGEVHRFEAFTDDFGVWVLFYGPSRESLQ